MHIYAVQIPPENQNSFISDDDAWFTEGECFICGNRSFHSLTNDVFDNLLLSFGDMVMEFESIFNTDSIPAFDKESESFAIKDQTVSNLLDEYSIKKVNGEEWSSTELRMWKDRLTNHLFDDNIRLSICRCLSLIYSTEFATKTIRGSSQSEWNTIYYDTDKINDEDIRIIESEYFNTGSEWIVHEGDEPPHSPDEVDGSAYYCHTNDLDEVKKELAEYIDDCFSVQQIVLWAFDGYVKTPKYITA